MISDWFILLNPMNCRSISSFSPFPTAFVIKEHIGTVRNIVSSVVLVLVIATAFPTILTGFGKIKLRRIQRYNTFDKIYEDEDGIATERSQDRYAVRSPRYFAGGTAVVGAMISFGHSVYTTVHTRNGLIIPDWITFGSWVDENDFYRTSVKS